MVEPTIEVRDTLAQIDPAEWNALSDGSNPFIRHEFLYALETTGCVTPRTGWYPRHVLVFDNQSPRRLIAACPAYVKTNSYGEFVFDWSWADAYEQQGLDYYPKMISAVPFTPATGRRLLIREDQNEAQLAALLQAACLQFCEQESVHSMHWLFITDTESQWLQQQGLPIRYDCQYHWHNAGYRHFDDFLHDCTSKRRRVIRRERRKVADSGVVLTRRSGGSLSADEWALVHHFYSSTFDRKWGSPSLTLPFFERIGEVLGDESMIVFAGYPGNTPIACAIFFQGSTHLYGRFWGCSEHIDHLHFEACYYQGIEHAIEHGLAVFEPGAQGEHKIMRGFRPTLTRSAHWIAHPGFRNAIQRYLDHEQPLILERQQELMQLLPFRQTDV